jgi:integrase
MQKSGTQSNPESKRERYVTHEEYRIVHGASGTQVKLLMDLTYRTLQRPESDILKWTPANVTRDESGARVIKHLQHKTKVLLKIKLTPDLARLVDRAIGEVPSIHQPIVHNRKGKNYTYSGIHAMLTAQVGRINAKRAKNGLPPIPSFGFRDLKGKGATDMWRAGVPIEQIQLLCGHADKSTTEKYIKARWSETATPNQVAIIF